MRSFGAAALFTLAIITECFGAQSDRSRSRSGPVRSVPIAADVKRDVDFDCPEEFGYYPHPTDCTLYYVCVFGGALLESCTGGLMYSHELQTCDWPRNVGCDGTSAVGGEELERINERDPPPPPRPQPRRTPPPPPPRAQPNPVITSRGQPKFSRQEYEKQQQLYEEVEDLPPVEEIESDRQQRVYRGQPPTIGQVQKDRDGYGAQPVSSGRNYNSNIIPASLPQNSGKLGSFSFGTQVDERRTATVTPAPQSYSEDKSDSVTDSSNDRQLDVETNEIVTNDVTEKPVLRKKREVVGKDLGVNETSTTKPEEMSRRSDSGEEMEYIEIDTDNNDDGGTPLDDTERGKRQVRYYIKNGYKSPGKNWAFVKPIKIVEYPQSHYSSNIHNPRYQPYNNLHNNNYDTIREYDITRRPQSHSNNLYSATNPFLSYQIGNSQSQGSFKPSLPDPSSQPLAHNPLNAATQIITKSPPISSLNSDPFTSLAGGFYNNAPKQSNTQYVSQFYSSTPSTVKHQNNLISFPDSSYVPSTIVTGKPVPLPTSPRPQENYRNSEQDRNPYQQQNQHPIQYNQQSIRNPKAPQKYVEKSPSNDKEYDDEDDSSEDEEDSSEEEKDADNDRHKDDFPDPPYEFTHPSYKYKDIENPFANPNFDFDAYLSKLSNGQYSPGKPSNNQRPVAIVNPKIEVTTKSQQGSRGPSSTLSYKGISTPKPFTVPSGPGSSVATIINSIRPSSAPIKQERPSYDQSIPRPEPSIQTQQQQEQQQPQKQQSINENSYVYQQITGTSVDSLRPKLKPPNFKDDRQLPISYSFSRPISSTPKPYKDEKSKGETQHIFSASPKPYLLITGTGSPVILSTPKQQYIVKPEKILSLHPHFASTAKPYLVSSIKPHNAYIAIKQTTPKPLTTLANQQLSALQQYWKNPSTESIPLRSVSFKSNAPQNYLKLANLFAQAVQSTQTPVKNHSNNLNAANSNNNSPITTTTRAPPKRRPIPKPSPEMNDYYYDEYEEDQYYYEPEVKPKYMPSTEVKPQRPLMAQNYKEYDDSYEDDSAPVKAKPQPTRVPVKYNNHKPESTTKNHNDVSIVTKAPLKVFNKNINGKIPVPVLVDYGSPTPNTLIRPEVSNYQMIHHMPRNRTIMHIRRPNTENGPNTIKPPKYLNQTTLRPYTVRHRLAKPTAVNQLSQNEDNQTRGRVRHPNIVAQMKLTTPRDNHNQETRFTKTKHDDKTNSLEPTESVTPVSYSPSPRPKMLYNGSQNYSPDQYDPFYAVYDEDGELYKDTDYVQQYNTASLRPAVQQTYRGTPPPAPVRRPVETYTPRPAPAVDYDDELIQPQINNQNQYQTPIRHSTRGEGNELGYDHNPSNVRTTQYEATTLSTTPSTTTSTSTTTKRPTTAPYTEAMTPSRYTPRSSTDESPIPESSSKSSDETTSSAPTTLSTPINFSSLAKPFEKTDNLFRLKETISTTETLPTASRRSSEVTNNNNNVEVVRSKINRNNKKVSLTSGFSIRRNTNNTNNPYTLTVLTQPLEDFGNGRNPSSRGRSRQTLDRYYYDSSNNNKEASVEPIVELDSKYSTSSESSMRRNDFGPDNSEDDYDIPVYLKPTSRSRTVKSRIRSTTTPQTTSMKYYIKSVNKRPTPFSENNEEIVDSTENAINAEALIETGLQNARVYELSSLAQNNTLNEQPLTRESDRSQYTWNEPAVSPFKTLDNLRNTYRNADVRDYTTSTTSTTVSTTTRRPNRNRNTKKEKHSRTKPSYYSYRLEDEVVPDQTTEIFNGKVKTVIKAFLNNLVSSPAPNIVEEFSTTTTPKPTIPIHRNEDEVVNIGYQKKTLKYADEKPLRSNVKRLKIIKEPTISRYVTPSAESISFTENEGEIKDFSSTTTTMTAMSSTPYTYANLPISSMPIQNSTNDFRSIPSRDLNQSKFSSLITSKPDNEGSRKFQSIINDVPSTESYIRDINVNDEVVKSTQSIVEDIKSTTETGRHRPSEVESEIASTTSTTKSTTTIKFEPTTSTTKSISFPPRASRVNPAIKLAATNPGGGRRSYQSSSKCSSDNSLQANPKCNEIKYQRPTSTRGRGSAHYSTSSDAQSQPAPNRGTPPTRSRPTLKPSTAIVTKTTEFVDIYAQPPSRPGPVYPQPTPDKTAAKCRKDVCLLPDCYCGGKEIPGDMPVEQVPQIVLLTFDDSVNDLNKGLYADLFEKGRVNPNGCPISATFYVSHEWTDYSQVQNLYSAGHEMASHTISHSFGEQFSQKKWYREVGGQREILAAYGGVKLEDVRGMRAPFLSVGGNKMFKMLHDANFTYDSSLPVYENRPPSWPYTLDYKLFHDCMIPPCPTKSYPGVWEVPMVMWQDLNGGRCSMGDACANPPEPENVYKMILKNFDRHYTTNRAPFGLFYHAAWFTQPHHKEGFIMFLDFINKMPDVWIVTNWQALQWVRDPTPISRLNNFQPFQCNYQDRPKKCNNPKVCNLWHKSGVRYMRTCQPCPEVYPWTGKSGIRSSRIDNDIGE